MKDIYTSFHLILRYLPSKDMNLVIQFDDEMFYMSVNSVYTLSEHFHCLTFSNDEEIQIMEYRGSDTIFFTNGWYHKNLHE